jgi:hypothetical protein
MMTGKVFTAWVTKYAMTEGILKMKVEDCFDTSPDMVAKVNGRGAYFHGKDWHRSHEAAIARAEEMRIAKLKSIDKQRARIAGLVFVPGEDAHD